MSHIRFREKLAFSLAALLLVFSASSSLAYAEHDDMEDGSHHHERHHDDMLMKYLRDDLDEDEMEDVKEMHEEFHDDWKALQEEIYDFAHDLREEGVEPEDILAAVEEEGYIDEARMLLDDWYDALMPYVADEHMQALGEKHDDMIAKLEKKLAEGYRMKPREMYHDAHGEMRDAHGEMRDNRREGRREIREHREEFHEEYGRIRDYLDADLSEEEYEDIKMLNEEFHEEWRMLREEAREFAIAVAEDDGDVREALEEEGYIDEARMLLDDWYDALIPYIADDRVEDFEAMLDGLMEMLEENMHVRHDVYEENREIRSALSESLQAQLEARLDAIPDEDKEMVYERVLDRIDEMLDRPNMNERMERFLLAIADIVAERLYEISDDMSEEDILDELF